MKKMIVSIAAGVVFLAFLIFAIVKITQHSAEESAHTANFQQLASQVAAVSSEEPNPFLKKYASLLRQNQDMIGWLSIEGTTIDYPVMYTPYEKDFYLDHDFEKQSSRFGVPYVAEHCSYQRPSDNIIIYGHHMKQKKMFGALADYTAEDFYQKHKFIQFDNLAGVGTYEIIAVFTTEVYTDAPDAFLYYAFADAKDDQEFDQYVKRCKELALYDTGVSAQYGDHLLTLSTCEYTHANGRLVVVAKKLADS